VVGRRLFAPDTSEGGLVVVNMRCTGGRGAAHCSDVVNAVEVLSSGVVVSELRDGCIAEIDGDCATPDNCAHDNESAKCDGVFSGYFGRRRFEWGYAQSGEMPFVVTVDGKYVADGVVEVISGQVAVVAFQFDLPTDWPVGEPRTSDWALFHVPMHDVFPDGVHANMTTADL
jgi:hypothetical protein